MSGQNTASKRKLVLALMLLVCFGLDTQILVGQQEANESQDLFDMSLEQLMWLDLEVVTASRQAQNIGESPMAVNVVTADDIHYSGLRSIPEILQFFTGMDVLQPGRNRYAVGVRGLHAVFSDRTLLLINGRVANTAFFGGVEWSRLPVLIEDIERIEILRGPGSAAWGANAYTGVINIITKSPRDVPGVLAATTVTDHADTYTHLRWAGQHDKWSWRFSAGYEDLKSSEDILNSPAHILLDPAMAPFIDVSSYVARDFARDWRFDTEAVYHSSEATTVSFGTGYSHEVAGDYELVGYFPMENSHNELVRPFTRIEHQFDNGSTGYLQWYGNFSTTHAPQELEEYTTYEENLEVQLDFVPADKHSASVGGNVRWVDITTTNGTDPQDAQEVILPGSPFHEQWAGLFAIDRFQATKRLTLEGQIRADWYSETHWDWSTRLSTLYAIDDDRDHKLRFGFARAFRAPLVALRRGTQSRIPIGPGLYYINVLAPSPNLRNEQTYSFELGYVGRVAKGITLHLDAYYQRFDDLIGAVRIPDPVVQNNQLQNIDGADGYGAECGLMVQRKQSQFEIWYAHNYFATDLTSQSIRSYWPARNKMGIRYRHHLPKNWVFNVNFSSRSLVSTNEMASLGFLAGSTDRLDVTLSKKLCDNKGEIMVGVSDVLETRRGPVYDIGEFTAHQIPGRTFFGSLLLRFK